MKYCGQGHQMWDFGCWKNKEQSKKNEVGSWKAYTICQLTKSRIPIIESLNHLNQITH